MSYLKFEEVGLSASGKTKIISVRSASDGSFLGHIKWHGAWRKYVFFANGAIFDSGCLSEIASICVKETKAHTAK